MKIVERIKNICISPKTEWSVIAEEESTPRIIFLQYVVPLAALAAIAGFISSSIVGQSLPLIGTYRVPIVAGIATSVFVFVMSIVGTFVMAFAINFLAAKFGGEKNDLRALKVAAYSYTPVWVAGILQILPMTDFLAALAGFYGLYLLYLGLPELMKSSDEKSFRYTAMVVLSAIILSIVINLGMSLFSGLNMLSTPSVVNIQSPAAVEFDKDSPMGKLQGLSKKMEGLNEKMDVAQKNGDPKKQMELAMESMGAILGGGSKVEPVAIEQLKSLLPDTFMGLAQKSHNAEKAGAMGIMTSKAEAMYSDDAAKKVTLTITDMGGVSGMLGLASWVNVQGEKEDEYGYEKTYKDGDRMLHEQASKNGGSEFSIVIAERFMLNAKGDDVDINTLKNAALQLPLDKLDAMKDQGIQR